MHLSRQLHLTKFRELPLDDPFFDSLKSGYEEFPKWFARKANENVYIVTDGARLSGMIYLKREDGAIRDVTPPLPAQKWLKVGTLKIEGRGTKLGERVLKKIFDTAIAEHAEGIYVTVFDVHKSLIRLFEKYGFKQSATKTTKNGTEVVLSRAFSDLVDDVIKDYPFMHSKGKKVWLLAIYPEYHSRLLPDSILKNEPAELVQDVSYTNTIHKVYIGGVPLTRMSVGDIVVLYRTCDGKGPAFFRSVATSLCVVEEVRKKSDFASIDAFLSYCRPHSVFSEKELRDKFATMERLYVAKMTYNAAFGKRTTRGTLLEEVKISEQPRWDFRELSSAQFRKIRELGLVNESLVVD